MESLQVVQGSLPLFGVMRHTAHSAPFYKRMALDAHQMTGQGGRGQAGSSEGCPEKYSTVESLQEGFVRLS